MITSVYPSQIYTGEPLWVVDRAKKSAVQDEILRTGMDEFSAVIGRHTIIHVGRGKDY